MTAGKRSIELSSKAAAAAAASAPDPFLANLQKVDHLVILMLEKAPPQARSIRAAKQPRRA